MATNQKPPHVVVMTWQEGALRKRQIETPNTSTELADMDDMRPKLKSKRKRSNAINHIEDVQRAEEGQRKRGNH